MERRRSFTPSGGYIDTSCHILIARFKLPISRHLFAPAFIASIFRSPGKFLPFRFFLCTTANSLLSQISLAIADIVTILSTASWGLTMIYFPIWDIPGACRHSLQLVFLSTFEGFTHGANLSSALILIGSLLDQTWALRAADYHASRRHSRRAILIALGCYAFSFSTSLYLSLHPHPQQPLQSPTALRKLLLLTYRPRHQPIGVQPSPSRPLGMGLRASALHPGHPTTLSQNETDIFTQYGGLQNELFTWHPNVCPRPQLPSVAKQATANFLLFTAYFLILVCLLRLLYYHRKTQREEKTPRHGRIRALTRFFIFESTLFGAQFVSALLSIAENDSISSTIEMAMVRVLSSSESFVETALDVNAGAVLSAPSVGEFLLLPQLQQKLPRRGSTILLRLAGNGKDPHGGLRSSQYHHVQLGRERSAQTCDQ